MIATWIIIAALIVLILVFFKMRYLKHRFFAILIVIVIIFLYLTFTNVIVKKGVDLKSFNGVITAGKVYLSWLWQAGLNVKNVIGNAIKMDWAGNTTSGGSK